MAHRCGSGSFFGLMCEFCDRGYAGWRSTHLRRRAKPARPYIWRTNSTQAPPGQPAARARTRPPRSRAVTDHQNRGRAAFRDGDDEAGAAGAGVLDGQDLPRGWRAPVPVAAAAPRQPARPAVRPRPARTRHASRPGRPRTCRRHRPTVHVIRTHGLPAWLTRSAPHDLKCLHRRVVLSAVLEALDGHPDRRCQRIAPGVPGVLDYVQRGIGPRLGE